MLNLITNFGVNTRALVIFLQNLGIIKDTMLCQKQGHREPARMVLHSRCRRATEVVSWRCCHRIEGRRCEATQSVYNGTIFAGCSVPIRDKLIVILKLLQHQPYATIMNEISVSEDTIRTWRNQCRQYFRLYGSFMHRIGGPGTIVEIDETQIGKRKYHVGRRVSSRLVLGGVERVTRKTFMVQIPDKSAKTLCSVIVQYVAPGGTVVTDQHAGYNALRGLGYEHLVVCHKYNFVNPQNPVAHTNTIESKWSLLKKFLRRQASNCPTVDLQYLLGEFLFHNDCINDQIDPSIKFLSLLRADL